MALLRLILVWNMTALPSRNTALSHGFLAVPLEAQHKEAGNEHQ
jgi:hypothetical protein